MFYDQLTALAEMSNRYGADEDYVLAGGGNTSYKNDTTLYIKGSGTSLATITPDEFVRMDRNALHAMWEKAYPTEEAARESAVLEDMMAARERGESRRPSVETLLHELFPQAYVLHVHPALVNGLTCGKNGKSIAEKLFPDAVWVDSVRPGYTLAKTCRSAIEKWKQTHHENNFPNLLFLENHGVFFAGEEVAEVDALAESVMHTLQSQIIRQPELDSQPFDIDRAVAIAPVLRMLYGEKKEGAVVQFFNCPEALRFDPETPSITPDHIVYTKAQRLALPAEVTSSEICEAFQAFAAQNGYKPRIVIVANLGVFCCGGNLKEAKTAKAVFLDFLRVNAYAESFGGLQSMSQDLIDFIVNWEVESYRSKVSLSAGSEKRLAGKIAIITGGAQGFGKGIADAMASEGAYIVIADMNEAGAKKAAADYGDAGYAVAANVTNEASVKNMIDCAVLAYGGLDVFVNNAGVVKAGSLEEMTQSALEFVTSVNYTGYFLCAKYASRIMKIQHEIAPDYMMDIIEINSKSGLSGSNKNFAYAGSKFGGIGLTQSFALELCPFKIKVNAICPGNFLNGPLWSDPERGLFVQYLRAGKVPGAKTVEDVRRFYEAKVPMNRGCETVDVARAIFYVIEQKYETGQAIPVTGGQEMLK